MITIEVKHVSKRFKDTLALDNLSLSLESGKIYGLIGRNGSGKTVLLKLICGIGIPTEGEIYVRGINIAKSKEAPNDIGAIIETPGFILSASGYANLKYLARLRSKISDDQIKDTMNMMGLDANSKKRVGKYSLGMRQRLGIAQAIMEGQDILLLDEPMNGLDIHGVEDVKIILKRLRNEGKTIVLASHHMEDINELCDKTFRLDNGKLID